MCAELRTAAAGSSPAQHLERERCDAALRPALPLCPQGLDMMKETFWPDFPASSLADNQKTTKQTKNNPEQSAVPWKSKTNSKVLSD